MPLSGRKSQPQRSKNYSISVLKKQLKSHSKVRKRDTRDRPKCAAQVIAPFVELYERSKEPGWKLSRRNRQQYNNKKLVHIRPHPPVRKPLDAALWHDVVPSRSSGAIAMSLNFTDKLPADQKQLCRGTRWQDNGAF